MGRQADAQEMRFLAVAESSKDAIIIGDQAGNVLFWNNGAQTLFGYQTEEIVGKPLTGLMPERYRTSHQQGMARLRDTGEAHIIGKTVELHGLKKTGEEFPLELTLSAWTENNQQFFGGIIRDISKRKKIEAELRESEEKYRSIFNEAVEGIYQTLPKGIFLNANPALSQLLGYDSPHALLKAIHDIGNQIYVDPARRKEFCQSFEEDEIVIDFRSSVYRRDGTVVWISENARVIRNEEGIPQWYEGFVVDINAQKDAEQLLKAKTRLQMQNMYLQEEISEARAFGEFVGTSPALANVIRQIDLVAPTEATVLILGESGTGKELVAREIHKRSQRRDGPLIRVNCGSIPRDLYESEFFGHARGAFTGAVKDRIGRFEAADGGSLFLDEVGEIPLDLQSKLLRVLQEQQYERVGEERTRHVDVRIIAATNRDLKRDAEEGRFRQDLFYRLHVFPIEIVPLRDRKEDIPLLADHFLSLEAKKLHCPRPRLTERHVSILHGYAWPGNVRELQNIIEHALITAKSGELYFNLPDTAKGLLFSGKVADLESLEGSKIMSEEQVQELIRRNTLAALKQTQWKIYGPGGAGELLGMKPSTLFARMKKMRLEKQRVVSE